MAPNPNTRWRSTTRSRPRARGAQPQYSWRSEKRIFTKLDEYRDFVDAFGSFAGYIEFFHLGDAVKPDGNVDFFFDFDDFRTQRLPRELDEYIEYRRRMLAFLDARRSRIQRAWDER